MSKDARIGIIGLGRMGARLAEAVRKSGHRVVAALDSMAEPFALGAEPELRPVFGTDPAQFWAVPMDALMIATTGPTHVPLLREGLAAGIRRFVVEKPFCTSVAEGRGVMDDAARLGARVVVNHGRRYHPTYAALAALDGTEEMGSLRSVSVSMGAGGLGCVGVHYLELFNRLFGGLPASVDAVATGAVPANPRGDQFDDPGAAALLVWADGRRVLVETADDTGIPPILEFRFTMGRVVIEAEHLPWRLFRRKAEDRALPLTRYGQPNEELSMPGFVPFGIIEMGQAALADALADGPLGSGGGPALDAIAVFSAIRQAIETGKRVCLPLEATQDARSYAIP